MIVIGRFLIVQRFVWNTTLTDTLEANITAIPDIREEPIEWASNTINPGANVLENDQENISITIAIPSIVSSEHMVELTSLINTNIWTDISVEIVSAQTFAEYWELLQDGSNNIDIALIPSSWRRSFWDRLLSLPFKQTILPIYHLGIHDYILSHAYSFIPFWFNPLVVVSDSNLSYNAMSNIRRSSESRDAGIGVSWLDIRFLRQQQHPIDWYTMTLQNIISYTLNTLSRELLIGLLHINNRSFRDVYVSLKQSSTCTNISMWCVSMIEEFDWTISMLHTFLEANSNESLSINTTKTYAIHTLDTQQTLPVDIWWFVVFDTSSSNKHNTITQRLWWFVKFAPSSHIPLRQFLLSPFNETLTDQLREERYQYIANFFDENKLTIFDGALGQIDNWMNEKNLTELLSWNISIDMFLEQFY